eukprot:6183613-Pleurochrysis_carterae.AAC.4
MTYKSRRPSEPDDRLTKFAERFRCSRARRCRWHALQHHSHRTDRALQHATTKRRKPASNVLSAQSEDFLLTLAARAPPVYRTEPLSILGGRESLAPKGQADFKHDHERGEGGAKSEIDYTSDSYRGR